jgi:hypothetical protein
LVLRSLEGYVIIYWFKSWLYRIRCLAIPTVNVLLITINTKTYLTIYTINFSICDFVQSLFGCIEVLFLREGRKFHSSFKFTSTMHTFDCSWWNPSTAIAALYETISVSFFLPYLFDYLIDYSH